jgi:hypothetical protein
MRTQTTALAALTINLAATLGGVRNYAEAKAAVPENAVTAIDNLTKEDPDINQPTIDSVAAFVPNEVGEKFNPHVTIGLSTEDYLKKILAEKFEAFTFSPVGVSAYHLGNSGMARKKLKRGGN